MVRSEKVTLEGQMQSGESHDRVVTRTRVERCQTLCSPPAGVDRFSERSKEKKGMRWGSHPAVPISPSLSIPFVIRHGFTPADPRSCLQHVSHSDISILAAKPGCSICFSTLRQITAASLTDGWFPEKCEEQDLPHLHMAHGPLIILIINTRRQRVEEKRWKGLDFSMYPPRSLGAHLLSAHALNTCAILCFTTHVWLKVSRWSESFLTHENSPLEVNTPYMLVTAHHHSVFGFLSRMRREQAGVMRVVQAIQLNSAVSIYFIWYIKAGTDRRGPNWWNARGQKVWVRNGRVMKPIREKVWGAEQWMEEKRN